MEAATQIDPLVLVVEDDDRTRMVRKRQLEKYRLKVIVADSVGQALGELENSPEMDGILTDLGLDTTKPNDTSGIGLARTVKRRYGDIPIVAYSAYDRPLSKDDEKLFIRSVAKGLRRNDEIEGLVTDIRGAALKHRAQRRTNAEEQLHALTQSYSLEEIDPAETVRRLLPHATQSADIEHSLREAGYHLELVNSAAFSELSSPVLVWVKEVDDGFEVEVYGQSTLYAHGATIDDAVERLVELMRLFAEDFEGSDRSDAGPASRLREFLVRTVRLESLG